MSFLPYEQTAPRTWWLAGSGAAVVHGGVIALGLASAQGLLVLAAQPPLDSPQYTITLTPLNSDTIAGLVEQQGEAGADDDTGIDPLTAEPAPSPEPEQLAALAPAERIAPDPVQPETVAPETAEAGPLIPDTPTAATPETLAPVAPDQPEAISPLIADTTIAAAPVPETSTTLGPVTPLTPTVETLRPIQPAALQSQPAAPPAVAALSAQDLAIADLLRRIRAAPGDPCFVALPRRDGTDGVGLAFIGSTETTMTRFSEAVLTAQDQDLRQTRALVDERQCSALNYIRQNIDYPATRMGVQLDTEEVPSGGRLTGVLRGTAGRYVTLLLIDNNGVVQDLQRFLSFSGNLTRFDVPVTRDTPPRDTKQLLVAIATRTPAPVLRNRAGQLAQDVFAGLTGEVANQATLAIATFDVRVR